MKKLVSSSLTHTFGTMLIQGLNFITLPIYARMMSQESFGQYSLFSAWLAILTIFVGFQTNGSLSVAKLKYEKSYSDYVTHAFTVGNLCFLVIALISFIFLDSLVIVTSFSKMSVIILLLQSYFLYAVGYLSQYFIQTQRIVLNLILSLFVTFFSIGLSVVLLNIWRDAFMARVVGVVVPYAAATIFAFLYIYSGNRVLIKRNYLRFTLSISAPLIFHVLGNQLLNQLDRLMIGKLLSVEAAASYSFGYSLAMILSIVLLAINTAWVPWFFEARKKNDVILATVIPKYLSVGLFLTIGFLTIIPELVLLMGGDLYAGTRHFVPMIALSYFFVFLYTFPINIQFYYENTKYIPVGTMVAVAINFILNYFLIPRFGIAGAALATVLSYFVLFILHHSISKKLYDYRDVSLARFIFLIVIAICYTTFITMAINQIVLRYAIGLLILVSILYYFKSDLLSLIKRGGDNQG